MTSQPHDLGAGEVIIDGKLHGWTGRPCPNCQGSGEGRGLNGEWRKCTACAGTGDEHGLLDNQPADMSVYYKTANQWLNTDPYKGITVLDPDGWDRKNLDASWAEPITQEEFNFRLSISTASYPKDFFRKITASTNT